MAKFKAADYGTTDIEDIQNQAGRSLFKKVVLRWSNPQVLSLDENGALRPFFDDNRPLLYAILRNHGNSQTMDAICYIGLSTTPSNRFANHPKARELAELRGETKLSYAFLDEGKSSKRLPSQKRTLEDIEHILLWALYTPNFWNDKKLLSLPGTGRTPGQPLHIINEGYRFRGQMPMELAYPWMLVKNGRDTSLRD